MPHPSVDRAKYKRIADDLRRQIQSGVLRPGDYLPAEKDLAYEFDTGRDTVRDAFRLLVTEGLVSTKGGRRAKVRHAPRIKVVEATPGRLVGARPASEDERYDMELPAGAWVLFEQDELGAQVEIWPADRTLLRYPEPGR